MQRGIIANGERRDFETVTLSSERQPAKRARRCTLESRSFIGSIGLRNVAVSMSMSSLTRRLLASSLQFVIRFAVGAKVTEERRFLRGDGFISAREDSRADYFHHFYLYTTRYQDSRCRKIYSVFCIYRIGLTFVRHSRISANFPNDLIRRLLSECEVTRVVVSLSLSLVVQTTDKGS